jgi:putative flippase GtrA
VTTALLHAAGSTITGILVGTAVAYLGTRHITFRTIRRLETTGRTDEATAARAVLHVRAAGIRGTAGETFPATPLHLGP